jgi:hypothetical protein
LTLQPPPAERHVRISKLVHGCHAMLLQLDLLG